MNTVRRRDVGRLSLALVAGGGARAAAQDAPWPNRPITLIVPYGAGSSTDILARVVARRMTAELGQPVVVENRAGGGGTIGSAAVARAAPDGYTLVMGTISSHSINAAMMANIPYRVLEDFTPVSLVAHFPNLLAVNKDLPANTIPELVAYARQRGGLNFATGGVGSSGQLAGELLKLRTGAPLNHVPYREIGQAITDTMAGHVPIVIYQVPALVGNIRSGQIKAIAVLAPERTPLLPEVPTPREQGVQDFDATAWMGLFGPARLPPRITASLQGILARAAADSELKAQASQQGFTLVGSTPAEFQTFVAADIAKWTEVVRMTGATID
ncbi:tripartite tricarboxylate transporter substrate binding protein [Roseomonas sp. JC162]|uniref:Tripartite tricarboxylate transporter substrate binding protein n=1 Tax=Neoroseomonas marina TaxID=1232220 RepID=A0A848ELP9_9PROT|nr:tripartite tricarboxylate transporter substrate binding protein [Neoroseomonas marina]NMJ44293.1 tripartite tricarboxylate transporter substrate binding protein [Neoroseomonas marina]